MLVLHLCPADSSINTGHVRSLCDTKAAINSSATLWNCWYYAVQASTPCKLCSDDLRHVNCQWDHACYFSFMPTLWDVMKTTSTWPNGSSSSYTRWAPHQPSLIGDMVPEAEGDLWPCKFCLDVQCIPEKRKPINQVNFSENCNDLSEKVYIVTKFNLSSFFWHQLQDVLAMHGQARTILNGDVKIDLHRLGI